MPSLLGAALSFLTHVVLSPLRVLNLSLLICLWLGNSGQACEKCLSSARVNRWSARVRTPGSAAGSACVSSISTTQVPGTSPQRLASLVTFGQVPINALLPTWPSRCPGQLPHLSSTAGLTFHLLPIRPEAPRTGELRSGFVHIRNPQKY